MKLIVAAVAALALAGTAVLLWQSQRTHADRPVIAVYKSPDCVCCGYWVDHVRKAGFKVKIHDGADMMQVKQELGVPASLRSCHTSTVNGKVIEGHVPASAIHRMLREEGVYGIGVAGMPSGTPGMQEDGSPFTVQWFSQQGEIGVYEEH
jgi:hypothetical protein